VGIEIVADCPKEIFFFGDLAAQALVGRLELRSCAVLSFAQGQYGITEIMLLALMVCTIALNERARSPIASTRLISTAR